MAATDTQMQVYVDGRIRPRAEQFRLIWDEILDDKVEIDAVYDRAANGAAWNDNRTDPPKLLNSSDVTNYNAFITAFMACINGTATLGDVATLHATWPVFQQACVRPIGS